MREYYGIYLNNKVGIKDDKGKIILKPIYDAIWLGWVDEGFIEVKLNDKSGLFDLEGNEVLPIKYELGTDLIKLYKRLKLKEKLLR